MGGTNLSVDKLSSYIQVLMERRVNQQVEADVRESDAEDKLANDEVDEAERIKVEAGEFRGAADAIGTIIEELKGIREV